jgi:hypothetical protein
LTATAVSFTTLRKGHHALALAVGALDVAAERADVGPVVAQAAGELGEQRVLLEGLVDAVEVVGDGGQVAARELRAAGAGVEQGRRRAHEVEAREHLVELDRRGLAVDLVQRQAHRHAHEEGLRQLDPGLVDVQEVAVVQGLQAEVVELQVAVGVERRAELGEVVLEQLLVEQLGLHAPLHELREVVGVAAVHVRMQQLLAEDLAPDGVQQQPRSGAGVARVLLDQGAGGEDRGLVHLVDRHAVVEVALGLGQDRLRPDVGAEAGARGLDQRLQAAASSGTRLPRSVTISTGSALATDRALLGALLRAPLAIEHVGAGDLVVAAAHQAELDLVLHVFYMEGAAAGARAQQRPDHRFGQTVDGLANACRGRALGAVNREERLHQRDRDLVRLERNDRRHCGAGSDSPGTRTRPARAGPRVAARQRSRTAPGRG